MRFYLIISALIILVASAGTQAADISLLARGKWGTEVTRSAYAFRHQELCQSHPMNVSAVLTSIVQALSGLPTQ